MNKVEITNKLSTIVVRGSIVEDIESNDNDYYIIAHVRSGDGFMYIAISLDDGNRWSSGGITAEDALNEMHYRVLQRGDSVTITVG